MNKKIFIKNRPFDVNDANDMQNWTEDALKKTMASIYSSGIVNGLNVVTKTGLQLTVNIGTAFNSNYDFINVSAAQTVTIPAANASNPRYDKIVISYLSSNVDNVDTTNVYGMGTSYVFSQNKLDSFQIQVIQGTAAASPVVPATPAGAIALAQVYVAANASTISTANITDLRAFISINSNINRPEVVFSASAPADTNVLWIDTTNSIPKIYKNSAWAPLNANDATTLDGIDSTGFALAGHNHDTVYYTKSQVYTKTESDTNYLAKTDNLSSLSDKSAARTNLGLGTMATQSTSSFSASNHNHDGVYAKGDYVLTMQSTEPVANTKTIWWDTANNLIKRYDGTSWVVLKSADSTTISGYQVGNAANNVLLLDSSAKVPAANLPGASGTSLGAMSSADFTKLAGIATGAEVNQNAFSIVNAGGTNLSATLKTDTLTLSAGTNISITGSGKTVTIATTGVETPTGAQSKADAALAAAKTWAQGYGLGDVAKDISNTDLNALDTTGFYRGTNLTNSPSTSAYYFIINMKSSATSKTQIAIRYGTSAYLAYFRVQNSNDSTWNAWQQLATTDIATQSSNGLFASGDKTKLDGIAAGAEVNQNAFTTVKVGAVNVVADQESDTLEIVAGTGITATGDATNDKVTIAVDSTIETTTGSQTKVNNHANRTDNPHSVTSEQVTFLGTKYESDLPSSYPIGMSVSNANAADWPTFDPNYGNVVTFRTGTYAHQVFYQRSATAYAKTYVRYGGTSWNAWVQIPTVDNAQMYKLTLDTGVCNQYSGDLNSLTTPGFYYVNGTATNKPAGNVIGMCIVTQVISTGGYHQIYFTTGNRHLSRYQVAGSSTWSAWTEFASTDVATTSADGLMSSSDKTKLNGIASGAEVNQNAFSTVAVSGQSNVVADVESDTLTLVAGANITLTTNATSDSVTIDAAKAIKGEVSGTRIDVIALSKATTGAASSLTFTVTFATAFGSAPTILPGNMVGTPPGYSDTLYHPHITDVTTTGCTVLVKSPSGNFTTGTFKMNIIAFGA